MLQLLVAEGPEEDKKVGFMFLICMDYHFGRMIITIENKRVLGQFFLPEQIVTTVAFILERLMC